MNKKRPFASLKTNPKQTQNKPNFTNYFELGQNNRSKPNLENFNKLWHIYTINN